MVPEIFFFFQKLSLVWGDPPMFGESPDFLRDFFVKPSLINISQKYVSTPQMLGTNIRVELNILGFTHILELVPPPPQCLARKSGLNDIYWVVHTSQESVSLQPPL